MGFPCVGSIELPKLVIYLLNLLAHVKIMVILKLLHLSVLDPPDRLNSLGQQVDYASGEDHPSPTLSVVKKISPDIEEEVKKSLPVTKFGEFIDRTGSWEDDKLVCAVCLSCLERSHGIGELSNCSHVFHKGCLDKWVDQGQVTCPLCRSKLLPTQEEKIRSGRDSWLVERISYLFGEDLSMVRN